MRKDKRSQIAVEEKRRFIRHPLCFPLTYKVLNNDVSGGKEKYSTTINISVGGLLFSARNAAKPGSRIMIRMPFQDKVFNVKALVVHCKRDDETKLFNIGVSFYRMTDAFKTKLIEQLYLISEFRDMRAIQLGREVSLEEASREWIKRYSKRFKRLYW